MSFLRYGLRGTDTIPGQRVATVSEDHVHDGIGERMGDAINLGWSRDSQVAHVLAA